MMAQRARLGLSGDSFQLTNAGDDHGRHLHDDAWPHAPRLAVRRAANGQGNWTVSRGHTRGYAREIANLINWLGADHVGIGTDIEGVGTSWSVNDYAHLRSVVDALQDLKLPASAIERVASGNYARVLKAALKS